ncbi:hypothetical protein [Bartonella sp. CB169]|uniref:hypothetical protein n=1 Tax=Bartonella sp. CB169 TaxID=3112257 RepID=UPI00300E6DD6
MRVGRRVTKAFAASEKDCSVSFYDKVYLTNYWGGKQFVHFKNYFQFDFFLKVGFDATLQLSKKIILHSYLVHQYKFH